MDKLAILQATALFSLIANAVAMLSGYWAIYRSQAHGTSGWNTLTIFTTGVSAVHVAADWNWYFYERGYAWPSWNFYQLMIFASLLIMFTFFFIGLHFYVVWRFSRRGRVSHAAGT